MPMSGSPEPENGVLYSQKMELRSPASWFANRKVVLAFRGGPVWSEGPQRQRVEAEGGGRGRRQRAVDARQVYAERPAEQRRRGRIPRPRASCTIDISIVAQGDPFCTSDLQNGSIINVGRSEPPCLPAMICYRSRRKLIRHRRPSPAGGCGDGQLNDTDADPRGALAFGEPERRGSEGRGWWGLPLETAEVQGPLGTWDPRTEGLEQGVGLGQRHEELCKPEPVGQTRGGSLPSPGHECWPDPGHSQGHAPFHPGPCPWVITVYAGPVPSITISPGRLQATSDRATCPTPPLPSSLPHANSGSFSSWAPSAPRPPAGLLGKQGPASPFCSGAYDTGRPPPNAERTQAPVLPPQTASKFPLSL